MSYHQGDQGQICGDAFEEMVMESASKKMQGYDGAYSEIRTDGAYIPSGENDNLIVNKLIRNTDAIGIFGYSFLIENAHSLDAANIDGVYPDSNTIASGAYPIARSLFFYIKNSHRNQVDGMDDYINLFMSEEMIGEDGILTDIGLIPLPIFILLD